MGIGNGRIAPRVVFATPRLNPARPLGDQPFADEPRHNVT
jgi:hypothetical protein